MKTVNRWRNWQPAEPESEPATTTVTPGFDAAPQADVIPAGDARPQPDRGAPSAPDLPSNPAKPPKYSGSDFDPLDTLWEPLNAWFNQNVEIDREFVAQCRRESPWSAEVKALEKHFCAWTLEHYPDLVPPTAAEFEQMLGILGCAFGNAHGERLILGVILREDLQAQRRFNDAPQGLLGPTGAAPAVKPEPKYECTWDDQGRPLMPHGVRLIRWAPLPSPARLSNCSIVTDVDTFIRTTLIQLDHALHNRPWLAGNWGVSELVVRLKAVGCYVALENPSIALQ